MSDKGEATGAVKQARRDRGSRAYFSGLSAEEAVAAT